MGAVANIVWNIPEHVAMAQAVGMEPLLEHAVSMEIEGAADQLYRMAHDQGAY